MTSLLLAVPPLAFAVGGLLVLAQLRAMTEAATDLQFELQRFGEVQMAVSEVRSATADARATARSLRRA